MRTGGGNTGSLSGSIEITHLFRVFNGFCNLQVLIQRTLPRVTSNSEGRKTELVRKHQP
jgi:hypothetical protein